MAQFTVRGEVRPFGPNQRNILVRNVEEMRRFWQAERIDTQMDWAGSETLVTVSTREFVKACEDGDTVEYTIETRDRSGGRGIHGVSLEVVAPAAGDCPI